MVVPISQLSLPKLYVLALKVSQCPYDRPKLSFGKIGFHAVDECRGYHDLVRIMRRPMIEHAKPRTFWVGHVQRYSGVVTYISVLFHIIPNGFDNLRRILPGLHAEGEPGTGRTIPGTGLKDRLAAPATLFIAYGESFDGFDIGRLTQVIIRGKGNGYNRKGYGLVAVMAIHDQIHHQKSSIDI